MNETQPEQVLAGFLLIGAGFMFGWWALDNLDLRICVGLGFLWAAVTLSLWVRRR